MINTNFKQEDFVNFKMKAKSDYAFYAHMYIYSITSKKNIMQKFLMQQRKL